MRVREAKELAAATCAHAVRGAGGTDGIGVGDSDGGSLHEQGCAEWSHRAAQLKEEEQNKGEHIAPGSSLAFRGLARFL